MLWFKMLLHSSIFLITSFDILGIWHLWFYFDVLILSLSSGWFLESPSWRYWNISVWQHCSIWEFTSQTCLGGSFNSLIIQMPVLIETTFVFDFFFFFLNQLENYSFHHISFLLNRPAPPLPELHLSEEMANEVTVFVRTHVNDLLSAFQDIALGRNSRLFFKVALCLWMISFVGGLTDFLTLGYTSKF